MATAIHKKQSESKYVTCFADSRPDVDITFRDVLLTRPTDHYLVGIDNFSMTNTSLSMIEPMVGNNSALIRVVKRLGLGNNPYDPAANLQPGAAGDVQTSAGALDTVFVAVGATNVRNLADIYVTDAGFKFEISSQEIILSVQQLMHRLAELSSDVNRYMKVGTLGGDYAFGGYTANADDIEHLKFECGTDGRVRVVGTAAFWSCFCIEIPAIQNQFGFFGARTTVPAVDFSGSRRFLTLNPQSAAPTFTKYQVNLTKLSDPLRKDYAAGAAGTANFEARRLVVNAHNSRTVLGNATKVYATAEADAAYAARATFNIHSGTSAYTEFSYTFNASVFSSLERRVALEVGCSLPVKNSPMVDHQKESPDFVLARWIWRTDPRIESNDMGGSRRYHSNMPACTEYQGAQDRINYHELQPQSKIQTLRIKLFARLRTFNTTNETFGMRVIELPTTLTDWWHVRLHFMSKD